MAGGIKGGVGTASVVLDSGTRCPRWSSERRRLRGGPVERRAARGPGGAARRVRRPARPPERAREALREAAAAHGTLTAGTATSLLLVATDATLDKTGCGRMATMAHDGLARAVAPVHTVMDGDAAFALATGARPAPDLAGTSRCTPQPPT